MDGDGDLHFHKAERWRQSEREPWVLLTPSVTTSCLGAEIGRRRGSRSEGAEVTTGSLISVCLGTEVLDFWSCLSPDTEQALTFLIFILY